MPVTKKQPLKLVSHRYIASIYAVLGTAICVCAGLLALYSFAWNENGTAGRTIINNPIFKAILSISPLMIYFASGVIAALSINMKTRISMAFLAHTILILIAILTDLRQIITLILLFFSILWFIILKEEQEEPKHTLTE